MIDLLFGLCVHAGMVEQSTLRDRKIALSRVALSDQVMELILERILDRVYTPRERLNIDALSRELNVSSSPIREALNRLSALSLVTKSPFAIAPVPSPEWFEQLQAYRIVAEGWAARQMARRKPQDAIDSMTQSLRTMERGALGKKASEYFTANNKADEVFHDAMLDGAGNEICAQAVRNLHPHLHHARLFCEAPQDIAPVIEEHRAILNAIVKGDGDAAAAAVEHHLRVSWERYGVWANGQADRN